MTTTTTPTERVGRYQLLEPIGIGPSGSVSRAKVFGVAGFERQFAVKRFHPELTSTAAMAAMLSAAARAYGSLEHPRIARMSEFGVAQGATFTAVEYVLGLDALRLVGEARLAGVTLAAGGALALVSQAARAVGYAHGRGLTHLGLAPTNVIVTAEGDIKITDFGILSATLPQRPIDVPRLTQRIPYLAPEQLANEATSAATDVFALGVLAYELVTGSRTFKGDTPQQVASAIMAGPPAEPPLPRPIVRVLQRCLARSPFERFPDARSLADALDAALRVAPVPGTRKDIGAQVKETLDRLAALNDGQMSGMVALHLGTGPIRRLSDDDARDHAPAQDPSAMLSYELARPDLAGGGPAYGNPSTTMPDLPRPPITTMPGLAPPPIPVPQGINPPGPPAPGSPPGAHTLMGMGKPPAIPPFKPRAGASTTMPSRPPAVPLAAMRAASRTEAPLPIEPPTPPLRAATHDSAIHLLDPSDVVPLDDAVGDPDDLDAGYDAATVFQPGRAGSLEPDLDDGAPTSSPFNDDFLDAPTHAISETRSARVTAAASPPSAAPNVITSAAPAASKPGSLPNPAPTSVAAKPGAQPNPAPRPASPSASQPNLASSGSRPNQGAPGSQPNLASGLPANQASPGSQPDQASPDSQPDQASPDSQPDQASPDSQPYQTSPGSQPDQASPGSQPNQASPGALPDALPSTAASSGSRPNVAASTALGRPSVTGGAPSASSGSQPTAAPSAATRPGPTSPNDFLLGASPSAASAGQAADAGDIAADALFDPLPGTDPAAALLGPSTDRAVTANLPLDAALIALAGHAERGTDLDLAPLPDAAEHLSSQTLLGFAPPLAHPRAATPTPAPTPVLTATPPTGLPASSWQRPHGETQPEDVQTPPSEPAPRASRPSATPPPGWITPPPRPSPITPLAGHPRGRGGGLVIAVVLAAVAGLGAWQIYERTRAPGRGNAKVAVAPNDARAGDASTPVVATASDASTPVAATANDASTPVAATASDASTPVAATPDAARRDAATDAAKLVAATDAGPADAAKLAARTDAAITDAAKLAAADAATPGTANPDAGAPHDAAIPGTMHPPVTGDTLAIASTPAGAHVFLDGADTGTTPVKLPGSPDRHTIALLLAGHELYVAQVDGHGSFQIPLKEVTPTNGPAGIKVLRCKPDRYYVFVDGKPTGQICPSERIGCEVGAHTVEVYDVVSETRRKWDIVVKDTRLSLRVRVE